MILIKFKVVLPDVQNFCLRQFKQFFTKHVSKRQLSYCECSKTLDKKLLSLLELYKNKITPSLPVGANLLMSRYKIPEGRQLGSMLKLIEEEWIRNNFKISDKQIDSIVKG